MSCIAAIVSYPLTHFVASLAQRWGFVDRPDGHHKSHKKPVALGGGFAVFLAAVVTFAVEYFSSQNLQESLAGQRPVPLRSAAGRRLDRHSWTDRRPLRHEGAVQISRADRRGADRDRVGVGDPSVFALRSEDPTWLVFGAVHALLARRRHQFAELARRHRRAGDDHRHHPLLGHHGDGALARAASRRRRRGGVRGRPIGLSCDSTFRRRASIWATPAAC